MTFKEAYKKLGKMADGRYCTLRYEFMTFRDGNVRIVKDAYIGEVGWTKEHEAYREVLNDMKRKLQGLTDNIDIDDEMPDESD